VSLYEPASGDYTTTPEGLTGASDRPRGAVCACCSTSLSARRRRGFEAEGINQYRNQRSAQPHLYSREGSVWRATVSIFQAHDLIQVNTRIGAINATHDTGAFPGTRGVEDAFLARQLGRIKASIESSWNARPYRIVIVDDTCGRQRFRVQFVVDLTMGSSGSNDYNVQFVNVPWGRGGATANGGVSHRSYVLQGSFGGMWNLADSRSASELGRGGAMEAHEYGHMLGLLDEYEEFEDFNRDGDGLDLVGGRWEADRGGMHYVYPSGDQEVARADGNLMHTPSGRIARPARYCITVLYAVLEVLRGEGRRVGDAYIEGQPRNTIGTMA